MRYFLNGGNMRKAKTLKYGILISLILLASLTSVMYALAYTVKREVLYTQTFKIDGQKQMFRAFYLSAPAVLFEATFDSFQSRINEVTIGTFQGWECETDAGTVKWRIDPENLNQVWYLSFLNEDQYEKEVTVEVTKVWSEQNIQDWI